jgi:hypothetical protein
MREKRERDKTDTGSFSGPEGRLSFLIFRNRKHVDFGYQLTIFSIVIKLLFSSFALCPTPCT